MRRRHYLRIDLAYVGPLGSVMKALHEAELCLQDLKFELRGSAVGERESDVAGPKAADLKEAA